MLQKHTYGKDSFFIREGSLFAKIAAMVLHSKQMAVTLNRTIHLTGISGAEFLKNERWVRHELCHIQQIKRLGWVKFIFYYLSSSIRYGYYRNPFEVEARNAEKQSSL